MPLLHQRPPLRQRLLKRLLIGVPAPGAMAVRSLGWLRSWAWHPRRGRRGRGDRDRGGLADGQGYRERRRRASRRVLGLGGLRERRQWHLARQVRRLSNDLRIGRDDG